MKLKKNSRESGILSTIGCTPMVKLAKLYPEFAFSVFAKLEMFNPGGSIKDRPAFLMLSKALDEGKIKEDSTIVESSSGNMAIGLAQACRFLGLKLVIVVDPKINAHTLKILQAYGATVDKVNQPDENGNYLRRRLARVQEILGEFDDAYWPNQYANKNNPAAHFITMKEIVDGMPEPPDYLFASTSTCGTIMGCVDYVEQNKLDTKIVAVDAVGSVIFGNSSKDRLVPGHGAGRPAQLLEKEKIDHVVKVDDRECIIGCKRLLEREAILAGGSSGAVAMAVEKMSSQISFNASCAIILPDSGERYLDTLYNEKWVKKNFDEPGPLMVSKKGPESASQSSKNIHTSAKKEKGNPGHRIAIIGGGPKGMYGFERLAAQFKAHSSENTVEIHVFNRNAYFGAGEIYRPGQPSYLLTNNAVSEIDMWIDEEPPAVVKNTFNLREWLHEREHRVEGHYIGRAKVGQYLSDGFQQIADSLPDCVSAEYVVGEVTDIENRQGKYALHLKPSHSFEQEIPYLYDDILLATGHPKNVLSDQENKIQQFTEKYDDLGFTSFIYPVESELRKIIPNSKVAMKGIGLTFIDAVLALTEGRGGSFKKSEGKLKYRVSGSEPNVIYPFSRSGLPMIPRKLAPEIEQELKFFTSSALKKLSEKKRKLDFKNDLLPLLWQEFIFTYYNVRMKQSGFKSDLEQCETFVEVEHHIHAFHEENEHEKRFDPSLFLTPAKEKDVNSGREFHHFVHSYLKFFIDEAKKGQAESPWAAVTSVWRKATPVFLRVYEFGGLTPGSQQFFDEIFRGKLNRVTFGPPVQTAEKLFALMEAGILNFEMARNSSIKINQENENLEIESSETGGRKSVQHFIDARISGVSLAEDRSSLYKNLLRRGLISEFKNEAERTSCQPGCIAISAEGFAINKDGAINESIAATGTPTEGITFDNDTLSRHRNNFVSGWAARVRKKYHKEKVPNYAG